MSRSGLYQFSLPRKAYSRIIGMTPRLYECWSSKPRPAAVLRRSNCLIFALTRVFTFGGYLHLRKSNYGWWPHVFWSADLFNFEEFTPLSHQTQRWPPLFFYGYVKVTNAEEQLSVKLRVTPCILYTDLRAKEDDFCDDRRL